MDCNYLIRDLTENDLKQIVEARIAQEKENGNGITERYINTYEKVLKKLFQENKIIAIGAFDSNKIISIGCFNLINFGRKGKIPYLCAVWTDPKYRQKGISNKINNMLFEKIKLEREHFENFALLTLEGEEPAYNLYRKLGYEKIEGEMCFLGDVDANSLYQSIETKKNQEIIYFYKNQQILSITFCCEQFFPHPSNINGKMARIIKIQPLTSQIKKADLESCLNNFFQKYRFCKFNVNELINEDKNITKYFSDKYINAKELEANFSKLQFIDINKNIITIKVSENVMKKDLTIF